MNFSTINRPQLANQKSMAESVFDNLEFGDVSGTDNTPIMTPANVASPVIVEEFLEYWEQLDSGAIVKIKKRGDWEEYIEV